MEIEKAAETGFCFGVRRAIDTVEKMARERGGVETLRAVVHNRQVLGHLEEMGVRIASGIDDVEGDTVVIGAHGVSPETEDETRRRGIGIIDTTCPFVRRAQKVANRLARRGFVAIIYGDASHPEVKGILGWAEGKGMATSDWKDLAALDPLPRRIGVLAQTTQIPDHFTDFAATLVRATLHQDSELRVIDTICHGIRRRQTAAVDLAGRADLMLVVGDHTSSNTNRLAELCALTTETRLIETADDVRQEWLRDGLRIGITGGTSTAEQTISQVLERIRAMTP